MADITLSAAGGGYSVGASWVGGVKPGAGDTAVLNATSGDIYIDEDTAALSGWDMTGYTRMLSSDGLTIDVDGDLNVAGTIDTGVNSLLFEVTGDIEILAGTTFPDDITIKHNDLAANARTVKTRGLTGNVKFEVANPGIASLTAVEDAGTVIKWKSFDRADNAKYAGGAFDHEIGGDLLIGANGVFSQTGKWTQTASGNLANPNYPSPFYNLSVADDIGNDCVFTAGVWVKRFARGDGDVSGAFVLYIYGGPGIGSYTEGAGAFAISRLHFLNPSGGNLSLPAIDVSGTTGGLHVQTLNTKTVTMLGDLTRGTKDLCFYASAAGTTNFDTNGYRLIGFGDVLLGVASQTTMLGKIYFRNAVHQIKDLHAARADADGNAVDFGSSYITLSGTILGERDVGKKITPTNVAARIQGGTVTDLDCSATEELTCFGTTDGTGNNNVTFDEHAPPGSLAGMCVGI